MLQVFQNEWDASVLEAHSLPLKLTASVNPWPESAISCRGMLQVFQKKRNPSLLEAHSLRQMSEHREENPAHALYNHAAACRVIARLDRTPTRLTTYRVF